MTVNITVLTTSHVYQAADFQLSAGDEFDDPNPLTLSDKVVPVEFETWSCLLTFNGVAQLADSPLTTASRLSEWASGLAQQPRLRDVEQLVVARGNRLLKGLAGGPHKLTVVIACFEDTAPTAIVVSNYESADGRSRPTADRVLHTSRVIADHRPRVLVTGDAGGLTPRDRRDLSRRIRGLVDEPARVRHLLRAAVQRSSSASRLVSHEGSVFSLGVDGRMSGQRSDGVPGVMPHRALGRDMSAMLADAVAPLGVATPSLRSFASTGFDQRRRPASARCVPMTVKREGDAAYELVELAHLDSPIAEALAAAGGTIVGAIHDSDGQPVPVKFSVDECTRLPLPEAVSGYAVAVNSAGVIAGHCYSSEWRGRPHAWRWSGGGGSLDLDGPAGLGSQAFAVSPNGMVTGGCCLMANGDALVWQPAVWTDDGSRLVPRLDGVTSGRVVAMAPGRALLRLDYGPGLYGLGFWDTSSAEVVYSDPQHRLNPLGLSPDGDTALVSAPDGSSALMRHDGALATLQLPPGHCPRSFSNRAEIVGISTSSAFSDGWVRRATGEVESLPAFAYHHMSPNAVMPSGEIVGHAGNDRGTHAVIWIPRAERNAGPE